MAKDWTGNGTSIFKALGASNHTEKERQTNDFYATDPKAAELLCEVETFAPDIWEPACGQGHLAKVFERKGYRVRSTDLVDRGFGSQMDFLYFNTERWNGDIITNPPYKFATEFVYKALDLIPDGNKVAMFLKVQFLAGSGTDTELFRILLADLLSKYSGHKIAARKAKAELKRKDYATEEDYTSAVEKAQEEALTYSEYSINLRNRITTDYESTRKQRNDFKIHLKAAIVALQKIGLLKAARFVNTDRGERVDYIFNFDYDKRERESTLLLS